MGIRALWGFDASFIFGAIFLSFPKQFLLIHPLLFGLFLLCGAVAFGFAILIVAGGGTFAIISALTEFLLAALFPQFLDFFSFLIGFAAVFVEYFQSFFVEGIAAAEFAQRLFRAVPARFPAFPEVFHHFGSEPIRSLNFKMFRTLTNARRFQGIVP